MDSSVFAAHSLRSVREFWRAIINRAGFAFLQIGLCGWMFISVVAAPADPDRTFGAAGRVVTPINNRRAEIRATAIQPDGRIVAVGCNIAGIFTSEDFLVVRYNADGSLDGSFGTGGIVSTDVAGHYDAPMEVLLQPDGKIVVVGMSINGTGGGSRFAVLRYHANGTLDTSFGVNGKALVQVKFIGNVAKAATLQPDGKIVVAGLTSLGEGAEIALVRLNPAGTLDTSFDGDGKLTDAVDGHADSFAVAVQADGKIVVAGHTTPDIDLFPEHVLALRYHSDGARDATFGVNGKVFITFGELPDSARDMLVQPDGKILLAGYATRMLDGHRKTDFAVLRLLPHGSLDSTFGSGGKSVIPLSTGNDYAEAVALQRDGKIIVAGSSNDTLPNDAAIVRLLPDGSFDPTFGTNGRTLIHDADAQNRIFDVALQPNGRIVAAGETSSANQNGFLLTRFLGRNTVADYDSDGKTDVAVFRPSNGTWYRLNSASGQLFGVQFGQNGDVPVGGDFDGFGHSDVAVFRPSDGAWFYQTSESGQFAGIQFGQSGDIPVPADFDGDGKDDISVFRPSEGIWYRLNSSDGSFFAVRFGQINDRPLTGDFDGDGKFDLAVFRPSNGTWYIQGSRDGFFATQFGMSEDVPVAGDYDGDQITDIAVFRPSDGVWYLQQSSLGFQATQWGSSTDQPVPGDFDGDGRTDVAVFRAGNWYILQSTAGFIGVPFGVETDIPLLSN